MKAIVFKAASVFPLILLSVSICAAGRLQESMIEALRDPRTWIPAAGAAVILASGTDEKIAAWAVRETPVFGSTENAERLSTDLRTATHAGMMITGLLVEAVDDESTRWTRSAVRFTAALAANNSASLIKRATRRTRPDGSDDLSFPSNHSTASFAYATLASRNLDESGLPVGLRRGLSIGLTTLAAGSAWGRVEAGVHYPSDVLVGAALGSFVSSVMSDMLIPERSDMTVRFAMDRSGGEIFLSWRF